MADLGIDPAFALLRTRLRDVISHHGAQGRASGVPFAQVQSTAIGALLGELAITIAAGPARCHRAHARVVAEELGRLVATAAVAAAAFGASEFPEDAA